jgi:alkylation response protein AidB-like acyl-CoA dehydrogenase
VDAGEEGVRPGVEFLLGQGLADPGTARAAHLLTGVARSDLASAFSAWAHRMVITYLSSARWHSDLASSAKSLDTGAALGVTAMAAGTARYLSGAPLPVAYRLGGDRLILDGVIPWASNLLPPYVAVTAAADADDPSRTVVVAFTDRTPGVTIGPYPDLVALRSTGSASIRLHGAVVSTDAVISTDLAGFVEGILPGFLLLQTAFCRGLTERALAETANAVERGAEILRPDLVRLQAAAHRNGRRLDKLAHRVDQRDRTANAEPAGRRRERPGADCEPVGADARSVRLAIPLPDLLRLRLRSAQLAQDAVRLELAAVGGRGYLRTGGTARRLRESAFLPIQAPTEVQLRWTLSRFA